MGHSVVELGWHLPGLLSETAQMCCQTNSNQSPLFTDEQVLSDEKVAPFAKGGVSPLLEVCTGVELPFEIKVIVYR